jgi:MraZ protein
MSTEKDAPLFAYASKCELDSQGRILLPQNLREFAGLTKSVTIVGCNNHAELWDSDTWKDIYVEETTPENIAAVMEELEF